MNYNEYGQRIEYNEYVVKKGDSLYKIAEENNTTVNMLTDINMLTSNNIFPGQVLLIPKNQATQSDYYFDNYEIKQKDTIAKIANTMGIDPVLLGLYNDFSNYELVSGQTIKIPRNNIYVIKQNDTIDNILSSTGKTAQELLKANADEWLKIGSKINL